MTAIPVRDVDEARGFYEGVLGLRFSGGPRADGSLEYLCGGGTGLFTYPTNENAGRSPATLAAWQVDDIEATAKALRDKGVALEDYDLPELKTERRSRPLRAAGRSVQGPRRQHPQRVRTGLTPSATLPDPRARVGRSAAQCRKQL